ncbi:MAG: hypothetical protein ACE5IZ_00775 [Dehalococcoidia bacterium]
MVDGRTRPLLRKVLLPLAVALLVAVGWGATTANGPTGGGSHAGLDKAARIQVLQRGGLGAVTLEPAATTDDAALAEAGSAERVDGDELELLEAAIQGASERGFLQGPGQLTEGNSYLQGATCELTDIKIYNLSDSDLWEVLYLCYRPTEGWFWGYYHFYLYS